MKYGRRIPDEVVVRMLENLEEGEFWSLLGGRRKLESIGLIELIQLMLAKIVPLRITKDMDKKYRRKHGLLDPSDMRKIAEQYEKRILQAPGTTRRR
ncbi:MAG: hypothetical protein GSR84_05450 [Desulfurococcales archaeon]|nr:hypothetical protein [Desulfurococcales archaeon]